MCVGMILFPQVLQNSNLFIGLSVEPSLIANNLQRYMLLRLVVISLQDLSKASLAQHLKYLVPVGHMVVCHHLVASLVVVVAAVLRTTRDAFPLFCVLTEEIDLRVETYLLFLEHGQPAAVQLNGVCGLQVIVPAERGGRGTARVHVAVVRGARGNQRPVGDGRKRLACETFERFLRRETVLDGLWGMRRRMVVRVAVGERQWLREGVGESLGLEQLLHLHAGDLGKEVRGVVSVVLPLQAAITALPVEAVCHVRLRGG